MSKSIPTSYLLIGGAAAAYFLFLKPGATAAPVINPATGAAYPTSTIPVVATPAPASGQIVATMDPTGSFPANYSQLTAMFPNLLNPNYQLTQAELNQYGANYLDLRQAAQQSKMGVNAFLQKHWHDFGVAEKRLFIPLQPPLMTPYHPPQPNPKSSGGGNFLTSAMSVAGSLLAILGPDENAHLNDAELQVLFTGAGIIKDILPFYNSANRKQVAAISSRLDGLLNKYR